MVVNVDVVEKTIEIKYSKFFKEKYYIPLKAESHCDKVR